MRIREKLSLIYIMSILLTALPAALWITDYAREKIVNRVLKNLQVVTESQVDIATERLWSGEPKLKSLARLIQERLSAPIQEKEINAFHQAMTLYADGIWRNKRENYDGMQESGIFLPDSPELSDKQKVIHWRIKQVMDTFGAAANRRHENVWYLSTYRSEIIYDKTFPEFVFEQAANNDYTQTPWVTSTSPEFNPERQYTFTPPLFDPVPRVWMVSALYPLYLNGEWIGSLGEDMQLTNVLGFVFEKKQLYSGTQHFLLDETGHFILAGQWQEELESSAAQDNFSLDSERQLSELLQNAFLSQQPKLLSKQLQLGGQDYIALGMKLEPLEWRYFKLVPINTVISQVQRYLLILFIMAFLVISVGGGLIILAIDRIVISRIRRLTRAIGDYEVGEVKSVSEKVQGNDEIMLAAREFDVMAERVSDARMALAESEERWSFALEGAGDGVWDWNIQTDEVFLSPQWKKMLGYQVDDIDNQFASCVSLLHPDDKSAVMEHLEDYLAGRINLYAPEFRMRCKDGSWKWLLSRAAIVQTDPEDKPLRMIGTHTDISHLKTIQDKLQSSTAQLNEVLEYSPVAISIAAQAGHKVIFANRRYAEMINHELDDTFGIDPAGFYLDKAQYQNYLDTILAGGTIRDQLTEIVISGAGRKLVLATYLPINYDNELCVLGWFYDVTEWVKAQETLRLHASVFDNAWEGIMITDDHNRIITVNHAFTEITGYDQYEMIGENPSILSSGRQDKHFYQLMWQTIRQNGRWRGEVWNRKKSGEFYAEIHTVSAIRNEQGDVTHYLGLFADITDIKNTERQLEDLAHYDALTQLANRTLLSDRLGQSLVHTRGNQTMLAVCFLDLDGFKPVNDMYGHEIGDQLLIEVARRLEHTVRSGDTVARMGGDEFVLLIANIREVDELDPILSRMNQKIAEKIHLGERVISVTASIGVALYPSDNVDADTLLRHADLSMYEAKQAGRNGYHIFDVNLDRQVHEHRARTERIASALQNNEFCLFYQPKVNMQSHEVTGMEALIRWQHPEQGVLGAGEFLPVIESHQLIISLGDWVLEQAMHQVQAWMHQGLQIQVSVNVSARQIQHVDFIQKLEAVMARYPTVPAGCLSLKYWKPRHLKPIRPLKLWKRLPADSASLSHSMISGRAILLCLI
ncbi:hypothetical protein MDMS009_286 [Methylophaga thiooxydans DMS010]|uniref:PAS fold family n=1 Tax=Methylophaga thiooxydans DMS010 TaxID=637616 RepID=C0N1M8_9GAMM|nr:hypothetical protein MDMS009_286 [Methylophaga thiooxydans DMS010]